MRSRIFWGEVSHWRGAPEAHSFRYPVFSLAVDSSEIGRLGPWPLIGRGAIFSVRERDYLGGGRGILEEARQLLGRQGESRAIERVTTVTSPRYFGYVFNPVSFHVCHGAGDTVVALVTEVNNTFGETHLYPLSSPQDKDRLPLSFEFEKAFFVSPFMDVSGRYTLTLAELGDGLDIRVELEREGAKAFSARLSGRARPMDARGLAATVLRYPLSVFLTMPRIHGQAARLYRKRASIYEKPAPGCPFTIRSRQNALHRARLALLSGLRRARGY